jgi:hypothetical protein
MFLKGMFSSLYTRYRGQFDTWKQLKQLKQVKINVM